MNEMLYHGAHGKGSDGPWLRVIRIYFKKSDEGNALRLMALSRLNAVDELDDGVSASIVNAPSLDAAIRAFTDLFELGDVPDLKVLTKVEIDGREYDEFEITIGLEDQGG